MQSNLIEQTLREYFVFDKIFKLYEYGVSLTTLRQDLEPLCRPSYDNNYRFIFLHYDTDYHITNDQPGIMLRNLQRILYSLDISNFFTLIITQKDLSDHLEMLRVQETTDDCAIGYIKHPLQETMHFDKIDVAANTDEIVCNFMSLNRVKRFHRTLLYAWLKQQNLLAKGRFSYGSRWTEQQ